MSDCLICNSEESNFFFNTKYFQVKHGLVASQILGYLILSPKRHLEAWSDMSEEELVEFPNLIKTLESLLIKHVNAERVYTVTISEAVRHLHFHLIPRSNTEEVKGIDLIQQATQQKVQTNNYISPESIHSLQETLKKDLEKNIYKNLK
ncbi:HIT domain-containing protein [Priestia aryabhattai]|uniref:HIT family protein n=1 Tax=Priestia aryabhattai TaxID=412384 RepID=UPI003D267CA5